MLFIFFATVHCSFEMNDLVWYYPVFKVDVQVDFCGRYFLVDDRSGVASRQLVYFRANSKCQC